MRASATTAAVRDRTAGRVAVPPAPPGGRLGRVRLPRSWRVLLPAAVGLPLLIMAGAAWLSWQQAWRAAETEMAHAADAAAEYARRLLDGQLLRIEFAEELLNGLSDAEIRVREPELHARLRRGVASGAVSDAEGPPSGLYVLVHDRNAFPLVSSQRSSVPRDRPYIDADFVAQMRAVPPGEVRISPVHPGRDTGRLFFSLARRRERTGNRLPEDEFDGFIVASAYVDAVADALRRLAPSGDDAIALVRADGAVLARSMGFEPGRPAPRLGPDHPALAAMRRGEARTARAGPSSADGRERIAAYRRVEGWPVYAVAGRDRAAVAARWRAGALPLLGLGLVATGLLAALTMLVRRKQEELAAANAGLEGRVAERTAALVASERRNREVLESLGDLLYALDRDGRVRFASRSLLKGWGIGEGQVLGRHLLELWPPLAGSLVWEAVRRGIEGREESHLCTVSPVLGRWIEMDVHPSGDGGVTVAVRDVHDLREAEIERRRAEGELRDLLATLDLGAIMARDLDGTVRFWSAGCERLYGWSAAEAAGGRRMRCSRPASRCRWRRSRRRCCTRANGGATCASAGATGRRWWCRRTSRCGATPRAARWRWPRTLPTSPRCAARRSSFAHRRNGCGWRRRSAGSAPGSSISGPASGTGRTAATACGGWSRASPSPATSSCR